MYSILTTNSPCSGEGNGPPPPCQSLFLGRPTGRAARRYWRFVGTVLADVGTAGDEYRTAQGYANVSVMLGAGLIFFLAVLQGATELFPVSSLGHAVLVPSLLRLNFNPSDPSFVPVLTVLHLGTAAALIVLYRHQWWRIGAGLGRAVVRGGIVESDERLGLMLIVATIPAGFVGLIFESQFKVIFGDPRTA